MERVHSLTTSPGIPNTLRPSKSWCSLPRPLASSLSPPLAGKRSRSRPLRQSSPMGCSTSKPTEPKHPPAEPAKITGFRKPGQTAYRGPHPIVQNSTKLSIECDLGYEKPRGLRRVPDTPPQAWLTRNYDQIAGERYSSRDRSEYRGDNRTSLARNSSRHRRHSTGSVKTRPTFGRMTSGHRKTGQHGRSASQVRREQQEIAEKKPYKYTGPMLKGKRQPGQVPSTALPATEPARVPSPKQDGKLEKEGRGRRSRIPGPLGKPLRVPEECIHRKSIHEVHGLRHAGESAAPPPTTPPPIAPKDYSRFKGKRKGGVKPKEEGDNNP